MSTKFQNRFQKIYRKNVKKIFLKNTNNINNITNYIFFNYPKKCQQNFKIDSKKYIEKM